MLFGSIDYSDAQLQYTHHIVARCVGGSFSSHILHRDEAQKHILRQKQEIQIQFETLKNWLDRWFNKYKIIFMLVYVSSATNVFTPRIYYDNYN